MEVFEIIQSVDIVEYISQFCELTQKSDGEFWGCSPLKEENTPSFSVNQEKQKFYDFSSGQGGNIIDFIMLYNTCDFYKALTILKKYANIEDSSQPQVRRLTSTSIAKKFKQRNQKDGKMFTGKVLGDDYMDRYEYNEDRLQIWLDEGISIESLRRFEVRYDSFSNRLVYPVRTITGEIINVCGRTLDTNFKENGTRKYTYFFKFGTLDTIYGLFENRDEILKSKEIILFEGSKSVMLADSWGIRNTGALLTSHLNINQFKILIRLGVRVVFALDAEVDIRQDSNIRRLLPYVTVQWLKNDGSLDDKDSPVDRGEAVFKRLYENRRELL